MPVRDPREKPFMELPVGSRFRIKPTPGCPKGQSPVYEKIVPEENPMDIEGPWPNHQIAGKPDTKNFLHAPIPVLLVVE